jgi:cell division protein FtsL
MQQLNIEANRQIAELHKQVDQNTRQTTDGKSKVKELSDQINDLNRQIR